MRLDDYTVVSLDQDLPTFGATCALLRWYLRRGPQQLVVHIRHVPLISGSWSLDPDACHALEDPRDLPQYHIVLAMN